MSRWRVRMDFVFVVVDLYNQYFDSGIQWCDTTVWMCCMRVRSTWIFGHFVFFVCILFVFCFLSIYARAHSCQWKCHLFDESPIKPIGLSQLLTLWPCLNSPILLPRGGAVRFMDWTQATGPLNSSLFSRRFLADIPHMGLGLKHVLEREKNQWPNGKVVMASHSHSPLRSVHLSQRPSSNSHPYVFQRTLSLKKYARHKSIMWRGWMLKFKNVRIIIIAILLFRECRWRCHWLLQKGTVNEMKLTVVWYLIMV